jgi:hypothetical protein
MTIRPRSIGIAAVVAALVVGGVWLRPRRAMAPEERIRAMLEGAARAAEERKLDQVVEVLSERFDGGGPAERVTPDDVRRMLALELLRGRWVSVTISSAAVIVDGRRARANVDAVLSRAADRGKGLASLLPGEASVHRFALDLEDEAGTWRVVSARWRPIGIEEALSGPDAPQW